MLIATLSLPIIIVTTLQNIVIFENYNFTINIELWTMNSNLGKVQNLVKQYRILKLKFDLDIFHIENDFPLLEAKFN